MKLIIKLLLLLICSFSFSQINLIDTSSWFEGTGSVAGFSATGTNDENTREMGIGPHGTSVLLWKTIPNTSGASGGWDTDEINIDYTKTYRFTVWVKKLNSNDGYTYFRGRAIDDSVSSAYSFVSSGIATTYPTSNSDLPTLDTWYLLVGYTHHSSYSNTINIGGIYNGSTGVKMLDCTDFKFQTSATKIVHQVYLTGSTNTSDTQYYYGPTIYEVNGLEPSIQNLINSHPDSQLPSKPTLTSTIQSDTTVDLSWLGATDNIGVTGYKVYKNGVLETTLGNVLTYQVTSLTATTAYSFTVTTLDASGNESIVSNTLNITTNSTPIPATNLLDTSTWTEGTGSVVGFDLQGTDNENLRELGTDPHGLQNVLWKAQPVDNNGGKRGWTTDYVGIDHTKTYRYTSWIKKTNSNDGVIYLANRCKDDLDNNTGLSLVDDGVVHPMIVFGSDIPELDEWYLLVGYMHESGYSSTTSPGGVYNTNGVKQANMKDGFKFSSTATRLKLSNYLEFSSNTNDEFFSYDPTLYEVNGQEPTIQELINAQPNNTESSTNNTGYWSLNNQDVSYNSGNVGIGTDTPDEKLAVNGTIHSKEVRVDLTNWPDYVFTEAHHLPTLKEIDKYIRKKGHLPNIPSAEIIEKNGLKLGDMMKLQQEKIEELTLYILQQQKDLEVQKAQTKKLESKLEQLEKDSKK